MKNKLVLFPIIALLFAMNSCELGGVEYDPGIEITTCDIRCGETDVCQTSRGDMVENQEVDVSFRIYGVNQDGIRDFPEDLEIINITSLLTVEGEGSVMITIKDASGKSISGTATSGNPAELTTDISLVLKQEKPTEISELIQSANIEGIMVKTINGPAFDVQLNLTVNECVSNWCTGTHPVCTSP